MKQKYPAGQERSLVEQAIHLQPMGTTHSRSSCAAMEEPMLHAAVDVPQRRLQPMHSHADTALGWRCSPGERSLWWGRRAEGACTFGDLCWNSLLLMDGP